jgi:hypothetical protein
VQTTPHHLKNAVNKPFPLIFVDIIISSGNKYAQDHITGLLDVPPLRIAIQILRLKNNPQHRMHSIAATQAPKLTVKNKINTTVPECRSRHGASHQRPCTVRHAWVPRYPCGQWQSPAPSLHRVVHRGGEARQGGRETPTSATKRKLPHA